MKKTLLYTAAAALAVSAALTSCDDNFTHPPVIMPPCIDVQETLPLLDFKAEYWSTLSAPATVPYLDNGDTLILTGRVCSSDESGNIYKSIVIQTVDEEGNQTALNFSVNSYDIYKLFPFGQEVAVYASGMSIGGYRNLLQFGAISGTEMTFMDLEEFEAHVTRNHFALPQPELVDTLLTTIPDVNAAKSNEIDLMKWQSRLIRLDNVEFVDAGAAAAPTSTTNRYIVDENGNRLNVRISSYSTFKNETLPYGKGSVVGILSYYSTDWQLMLNGWDGLIDFDGEAPEPVEPAEPAGDGTLESPYNVAKALDLINSGNIPEGNVYMQGYVLSAEIDTSYGNATYTIVDEGQHEGLLVYRGYYLAGAKFTSADQLKSGDFVVISGTLVNFMGNTPEVTTGSSIISINGESGSTTTPPSTDPGEGTGAGTATDPYNVAKAISLIASGQMSTNAVYVKGKISSISEISTSFGNATYKIVDEDGGTEFTIFRGYWLDGEKFTSENQLAVGAEVVVCGQLINYNGTYEMATGNHIYSYNGQTGSGTDTPDTPDTPANALYSMLSQTLTELPSDWTISNVTLPDATESIWSWRQLTSDKTYYLNASAFVSNVAYESESYFISPVLDLTGVSGASFSFDHTSKFQTTLRTLCGVVVREEGATAWTSLTVPTWPEAGTWDFANSGAISLAAYDGKKIQIAFKYASSTSGADTWEIRNLVVTGTK